MMDFNYFEAIIIHYKKMSSNIANKQTILLVTNKDSPVIELEYKTIKMLPKTVPMF